VFSVIDNIAVDSETQVIIFFFNDASLDRRKKGEFFCLHERERQQEFLEYSNNFQCLILISMAIYSLWQMY
jgi:hypothetical protein